MPFDGPAERKLPLDMEVRIQPAPLQGLRILLRTWLNCKGSPS